MVYEQQVTPVELKNIWMKIKTFIVCRDVPGLQIGTLMHLREWEADGFTGREATATVIEIDRYSRGLGPGWCVTGIRLKQTASARVTKV